MDREQMTERMKQLKAKAKAARTEGKKDIAKAFRSGAKHLQRKLAATAEKGLRKKKKAGDE